MANELKPYRYERPHFGEFGRLEHRGDLLVCHICGREYRSLGLHAFQAHGIPAREYKEVFGLVLSRGLVGRATHTVLAENARRASHTAAFIDRGPPDREAALRGSHRPRSRQFALENSERRRGYRPSPETRRRLSEIASADRVTRAERARSAWAALPAEERLRRSAPGRAAAAARPKKTHCVNGHERTPENLTPDRKCRTCVNARSMARYYADRN